VVLQFAGEGLGDQAKLRPTSGVCTPDEDEVSEDGQLFFSTAANACDFMRSEGGRVSWLIGSFGFHQVFSPRGMIRRGRAVSVANRCGIAVSAGGVFVDGGARIDFPCETGRLRKSPTGNCD